MLHTTSSDSLHYNKMSEKEVSFVDLTADESRDEKDEVDVASVSRDDAIDVSEVQDALEQIDLEVEGEEEAEAGGDAGHDVEEELEEQGSRDEPEAVDESHVKSHDELVGETEDTTDIKEDANGTDKLSIDPSTRHQDSPIALETKEVLEMTEDGDVDEEEVEEAVQKEEAEVDAMEDNAAADDEADHLAVPEAPQSESSFGEFASEDEFGDFDDFEEMQETEAVEAQQVPTLDTSREETPMASQTNLSMPQASPSVKSVLADDSFSSFTSLSFAAKSVLEDNGLAQVFPEPKEPAGQKFELSESASQIYALLCSVPTSELNFLKSFTRRLLLKDVGVPLDLDELLPRKEKQHLVIRRSRRSLDKTSKSRDSTDGKTPTGGSRAATPTPTDSSRAQTPVTVDTELKLDSWLRLVEIRPEQRERMEQEELQELVNQLKTANSEAKLLLKQWEDKLALGYKNKEAFEAVVENMVGFAQKQRLKKGGKKK